MIDSINAYGFTRTDRFSDSRHRTVAVLDNDGLRRIAPSIFAETPWQTMSARYKFIPTIQVIDWMREAGFLPVRALQSRSRIEGKREFTKHMVRFRHKDNLDFQVQSVGQEFPEITLVNSHDGTASYQFYPSIFRAVCTNGLIVHSQDLDGVNVRHKGGEDFHSQVIDATYRVVEETPKTLAQIETFKQIQLSPPQREAFGRAALELQASEVLEPAHLLRARRSADMDGTLWTTLNTVQENLIRGGITARNPQNGRRITTKGVKSVDGDVKTNRALWRLAEEMQRLVG